MDLGSSKGKSSLQRQEEEVGSKEAPREDEDVEGQTEQTGVDDNRSFQREKKKEPCFIGASDARCCCRKHDLHVGCSPVTMCADDCERWRVTGGTEVFVSLLQSGLLLNVCLLNNARGREKC